MDGRTVGTNWYGTVRGTDFRSEILFGTVRGTDLVRNFIWYGTWYGFWSGIRIGTVRGTEFGTKIRSGTDNPDRYGFWYGFRKIMKKWRYWISTDFLKISKSGSNSGPDRSNLVRYGVWSGTDLLKSFCKIVSDL